MEAPTEEEVSLLSEIFGQVLQPLGHLFVALNSLVLGGLQGSFHSHTIYCGLWMLRAECALMGERMCTMQFSAAYVTWQSYFQVTTMKYWYVPISFLSVLNRRFVYKTSPVVHLLGSPPHTSNYL